MRQRVAIPGVQAQRAHGALRNSGGAVADEYQPGVGKFIGDQDLLGMGKVRTWVRVLARACHRNTVIGLRLSLCVAPTRMVWARVLK